MAELHRIKDIWDRLHNAAQAAVEAAADSNARVLGITDPETFAGAVNELAAVLDDNRGPALDALESSARQLAGLLRLNPTDLLTRPGAGDPEFAVTGAVMMMRGNLAQLDEERARMPMTAAENADQRMGREPGTYICDWCGSRHPTCYFPVTPYEVPNPHGQPFPSGDRFYTCAGCRPLVEGYKWKELAQRTGLPWPLPQTLAPLWLGFKKHRTGDAVDLDD